jgi:hypothetical protein
MIMGSKARSAYYLHHGLRQRRKAGQLDQMSTCGRRRDPALRALNDKAVDFQSLFHLCFYLHYPFSLSNDGPSFVSRHIFARRRVRQLWQ